MNAPKYHWYETSLSQVVLKHVVSNGFIFKKSVQGTSSYQKFSCHGTLATFKKKTSTCAWVTSGLFCGSTGATRFQP